MDEAGDHVSGLFRLLHDQRVSRAADRLDARAVDQLRVALGHLVRNQAVVLGADDERRAAHAFQAPLELRVEARIPGEAGEGRRLAELVLDLVEALDVRAAIWAALVGSLNIVVNSVSGSIAKKSPIGLPGIRSPIGSDQREALEPPRVEDGELRRDPAAERVADHVHALELERIEQRVVVDHEVVEAVEPLGHLGLAETGMLGAIRSRDWERRS